jgi:hypothetical protein
MKRFIGSVLLVCLAVPALANDFTVKSVKGSVEVRRDVLEEWKPVRAGDILRPEDTMRTGKKSSAVLTAEKGQITIPEMTMVDMADFRQMTQEEFLLKLAMENILAVPPRQNNGITIPQTTVLHGSNVGKAASESELGVESGIMQLQGAKLLFDNSFYATSILKTKETLRLYPSLQSNIDPRFRVAQAFEKMKLSQEATNEYAALLSEKLTPAQRTSIQSSLDRLRKGQDLR